MTHKYNPLYLFENNKWSKEDKNDSFNATAKYQRKYGFEKGTDKHATWNNESDAFKHAFWQAKSTIYNGENFSKTVANAHEAFENQEQGQTKGEGTHVTSHYRSRPN